jgi:hypothetical protein
VCYRSHNGTFRFQNWNFDSLLGGLEKAHHTIVLPWTQHVPLWNVCTH